jgi:hypothetical protein
MANQHPSDDDMPRTDEEWRQRLDPQQYAVCRCSATEAPFTGKYSLFGKLFASYDFYGFAGPGFINVKPSDGAQLTACADGGTASVCAVNGMKFGATFGVGMHTYFAQAVALNLELRDMYAQLNPSGRDVNGDTYANNDDLGWTHTWIFGANVVLYLPATASISP